MDFNKNLFFRINKLTGQFEDRNLEKEFRDFRWEKIRNYVRNLLIISQIFNVLINIDDIRLLGPSPWYIGYHALGFGAWMFFLFFLSDKNKKKWHQVYLTISIIGFMNVGCWSFYFIDPLAFPVKGAVLPIIMILWLYVWPYFFLNAMIVTITTTIPFCFLLLNQVEIAASANLPIPPGSMTPDQIPYLFGIPFIFLTTVKWSTEKSVRIDFVKTQKLEANRKLMNETLQRYFGQTLTEKILKDDGVLLGENSRVTISFTDITSYSTIIEHMSPETAVKFLNEYFTAMHDVIEKYDGHIVNYIGDSVMVVYGAPKKVEEHEQLAVKSAIGMREKLNEMNQKWDETEFSRYWKNNGIDKIKARTGIHTGSVIAGNIGSERMLQYSTIGDVVNVAARLEQANKEFDTDILITQEIYTTLTKDLHTLCEFKKELNLKGRDTPTKLNSL